MYDTTNLDGLYRNKLKTSNTEIFLLSEKIEAKDYNVYDLTLSLNTGEIKLEGGFSEIEEKWKENMVFFYFKDCQEETNFQINIYFCDDKEKAKVTLQQEGLKYRFEVTNNEGHDIIQELKDTVHRDDLERAEK